MKGWGKREIPEKTPRPSASSDTIPTCEYPGATPLGIESVSPSFVGGLVSAEVVNKVIRGPESRRGRLKRIWSSAGMKERGKREIPEKTRPQTPSSSTILTCENPVTRLGIEPLVGSERANRSATVAPSVEVYGTSCLTSFKVVSNTVHGALAAKRQTGNTIGCMRSVNVRYLSSKCCDDVCLIAGNEPWTTAETTLKEVTQLIHAEYYDGERRVARHVETAAYGCSSGPGRCFQHRISINVWCGVLHDQLIGPFIFSGRLIGVVNLQILHGELPLLREDIPLAVRRRMIFQHDGAPPLLHRAVVGHLNVHFPEGWRGRGGFHPWPPRSPWGWMKDIVYLKRLHKHARNYLPESWMPLQKSRRVVCSYVEQYVRFISLRPGVWK
ncbi:hypothetical protein PR048_002665 [Dryococelus australis]|uniref:Uncharacterized protein n=1 Tax=Dryococelus australis TaxID=614101 RepID=A0ABQ9IKU4_9NEOP|nr:hypothetical protein PR048_002665 [Dryococelus australis]